MQCFYLIIFSSLLLFTTNKVNCKDSTNVFQIDIDSSFDPLEEDIFYDYKSDSFRLVADLELDENGYLTLPILYLFNKLDQAVYLVIDELVLVDDINYPETDFTLSPFSSFIYLYNKEKEITFSNKYTLPSTFPCYFRVGKKGVGWSFSIEFKKKKFREALKNNSKSRARLRAFYFMEEDIKKIENELGTTIRYSQIQSRNFKTVFLLDLEDKHIHEFELYNSNSEKVDENLLKIVFEKYLKPIELDFEIYDLFR